jgi:predicted dehydrogenase
VLSKTSLPDASRDIVVVRFVHTADGTSKGRSVSIPKRVLSIVGTYRWGDEDVDIADPRIDRLADAQRRYAGIETCQQSGDLLAREDIDAFVIATPPRSHFELALAALHHGKHVLVEKPLAGSSEQARCLVAEAERGGLALMVDHTFVYTGAVRKICELVKAPDFGEVYYFQSTQREIVIMSITQKTSVP